SVERVITIDLDGIQAGGSPGYGTDTTFADIVAELDAIANLHAGVPPDGRLRLYSDAGHAVSLKDDSSGVLAARGVSPYSQGVDARDIAVAAELKTNPLKLTLGLADGTNETALAIAALRDTGVESLDGDTLNQRWLRTVERTAVETLSARTEALATAAVREN